MLLRSNVVVAQASSAEAWLHVWERASALGAGFREVELLRQWCAPASHAELAALPLGDRDRLLLELRAALFGPLLECLADCVSCGARSEWSCEVEALTAPIDSARPSRDREIAPGVHELSRDGVQVRFRMLQGLDLAALSASAGPEGARTRLVERCVLGASREATAVSASELPETVIEALALALTALDPQAAAVLAITCPACGEASESDFDIASFLWAELDNWAKRLLLDVHHLASQYGWSERDILALSPIRRARYLALVAV